MSVPKLDLQESKWSLLRREKVAEVAEKWGGNANLVLTMEDRKLGNDKLAVLQKQTLEQLLAAAEERHDKSKQVATTVNSILKTTQALKAVVEKDCASTPNAAQLGLVELLIDFATQMQGNLEGNN